MARHLDLCFIHATDAITNVISRRYSRENSISASTITRPGFKWHDERRSWNLKLPALCRNQGIIRMKGMESELINSNKPG